MLTAHTWCTADPTLAQHTLHTLVEGDAASDATGRATEPRRFEA
jgi:hypothetical protein